MMCCVPLFFAIQTVTIGRFAKNLTSILQLFQSIHAVKLTIHAIGVNILFRFSDIANKSKKRWNMINIAICDDEPNVRAYLSSLVKKQDTECEITEYASAGEYLSAGRKHDLLFLDVEMQDHLSGQDGTERNGMWLAREIRRMEKETQPIIIFVTGYREYVFDAFDVNAFQYLLKPIDTKKFADVFQRAVRRILDEQEQKNKKLVIQYGSTNKTIPVNHIYYVESQNHKAVIHAEEGTFEYYTKMEELERELSGKFYRIHRGYLINLSYVDEYNKLEATMMNGDKLLISKYKYDGFVRAYLDYIAEDSL